MRHEQSHQADGNGCPEGDFQGVRDVVVLSMKGLTCHLEGSLRRDAAQEKNPPQDGQEQPDAARVRRDRAFTSAPNRRTGPGRPRSSGARGSIAELSRAMDEELKKSKNAAAYKDKVKHQGRHRRRTGNCLRRWR